MQSESGASPAPQHAERNARRRACFAGIKPREETHPEFGPDTSAYRKDRSC